MHLLTAKPGGYDDQEGIIDLGQSAADIVILSAQDSSLAALAQVQKLLPENYPSIRLANWLQLIKPAAFDLYEDSVLSKAKVIILSLLGGESYWSYGVEQLRLLAQKHAISLIFMPGDDQLDLPLMAQSTQQQDQVITLWRYLRGGGQKNLLSFYHFLGRHFFDLSLNYDEPEALPNCFIYDKSQGSIALDQWNKVHKHSTPVVALFFYKSHIQSGNLNVFDALIQRLQHAGLSVLPLAIASLKNGQVVRDISQLLEAVDARLILNTTGFASQFLEDANVASEPTQIESLWSLPVLQLILCSGLQEDWEQSLQGLKAKDMAMQVVLPEMDGRIITRPVSFKAEAYYDKACQISVVQYQAHFERIEWVVALAKRICALQTTANSDKKLALILANYPTQDGRIGNGVGLDTLASTLNILNKLNAQDYDTGVLPQDTQALIEQLTSGVTNDLSTLGVKGCWQSLALEDYQAYFAQLPQANQQAVLARWGEPCNDPKYRHGRLMIAGFRLHHIFVGIQPARGFNMDLNANYHDPDLVPPHSYLAFYFWLRKVFQVNAVVHVGKHGNLEWLPGKGSGLSDQCWPDAVLGPVPHFYPFIVNDPGEGSQAKRRTQAVIIDHLMPPLTRAETYGPLFELESLVDEFYQASEVDQKRSDFLKQQIVDHIKNEHIVDELPNVQQADDDTLLEALDAYLCDIKEAQIRQGLHILGQLPDKKSLVDTLVALIRLPRGRQPREMGILHALSADLSLTHNDEPFNPLQGEVEPWVTNKPERLNNMSDTPWRTTAHARERLECLAKALVEDLLASKPCDAALYPVTAQLLSWVSSRLLPALHQSVDNELNALMDGLSGKFVPAGPSGAPTRGRLDTLPTGKNFYSVDNRSIPSKTAWALGKKSADNLIMRHLQEHGDYPRQLGLSVWGTATMRTGGDDIAQAFALMGVEPVWAEGSSRVIDFTIIPAMLLGRPRVDVTLRVSGFFRDAFINVIRLFDAAVNAIAELEEPGQSNTIAQHISDRVNALVSQGVSEKEARQQAGFRVFGSKPGSYGAGLQGLIDEKCWEKPEDLAEAYVNWGGYAYSHADQAGMPAKSSFEHQLSQIDTVIQNQDNREHDILDSDDYYQFQGGMINAVSALSDNAPASYLNDHSNPEAPKVRTLKEELNRVIRSRVLNPKWIEGMKKHGHKGAFEMAATVDYLFAYDATTQLVEGYQYQQVTDTLLLDPQNQQFMQDNNPEALQEMGERLLEAIDRNLWDDQENYRDKIADVLNFRENELE
ncbi:MAG: cobaltochelatase subunit CobN [Cellvibrionales bacterium]|nr:cobaltochelatase subunit CobN [Cellvibrionales bacterium]